MQAVDRSLRLDALFDLPPRKKGKQIVLVPFAKRRSQLIRETTPVTSRWNLIRENVARCNSIWSLPPVIGRPRLTFFFFFSLFRTDR